MSNENSGPSAGSVSLRPTVPLLAVMLLLSGGGLRAAPDLVDFTSPHPVVEGRFGSAVSGVPDVTGDGRGDLVVGAFIEDGPAGSPDAGRAYVLDGAAGQLWLGIISPHPEPFGQFGYAVAGTADTDGDGRGDLLIGAPFENPDGAPRDSGRAYLISGFGGKLLHEFSSPGPEVSGWFGSALAATTDLTGDGRPDFIIGAWRENPPGQPADSGRVHLFDGANRSLIRTLVAPAPQTDAHFGNSVAGVPDTNGDGIGDVLVGADWEEAAGTPLDSGRAYLFDGATGALLRTLISPKPELFGSFGFSVAGASDADGDGFGDLIISAWLEDAVGRINAGRVHLFSGATGALLRTVISPSAESFGFFGFSVAGLPDANGDGFGDILVGAPQDDPGLSPVNSGRLYIISGATGEILRDFPSPSPEFSGSFGAAVAAVPDMNRDGLWDVAGGAPFENPGGAPNESGMVHLYSSAPPRPSPTNSPNPTRSPTPTPSPTAMPSATAAATATPSATSTAVPCCPGDADNSGSFVDANDFIAVQANFGADNGAGGPGDANCSGSFVDANDFIAVQANFGADCG